MTRKYFYLLIISLLLVSNFVLLYFVLQKPNKGFNPDKPKNIIIEKLQFDKQQIVSYQKLIDQHRKDISENDFKILAVKNQLYSYLKTKESEIPMDSLTNEIGTIQKEIEEIHFKHFLAIKALCKPEQLSKFDILADNFSDIFNHKKHQKQHPK